MTLARFAAAVLLAMLAAHGQSAIAKDCKPSINPFTLSMPMSALSGRTTQEGEHLFVFTMTWSTKQLERLCLLTEEQRETFVQNEIARLMSEQKLCPNGWDVTSRQVTSQKPQTLIIDGRCRLK